MSECMAVELKKGGERGQFRHARLNYRKVMCECDYVRQIHPKYTLENFDAILKTLSVFHFVSVVVLTNETGLRTLCTN